MSTLRLGTCRFPMNKRPLTRSLSLLGLLLMIPLLPLAAMGGGERERPSGATSRTLASPPASLAPATLPLTRIVLFTNGIGYFERTGQVTGDSTVSLDLPAKGINDLLASLVVRDGGGRVTSVRYASSDPLSRTLGALSIDLSDNPSLATILLKARGERVRVEAPDPMVGAIASVESRQAATAPAADGGEKAPTREAIFVNLLTNEGLRSIDLDRVVRLQFLNPRVQGDLANALALMAERRAADGRRIEIGFAGRGTRPASIAYLSEAPVWKCAYRLILDREQGDLLQGWAIVENRSGEDWRSVRLGLVSGQPLSFIMNLEEPVYTRRPEVEPMLPPSIAPQLYGQSIGSTRESDPAEAAAESSAPSLKAGRAFALPPSPAPRRANGARREEAGAAADLARGSGSSARGASLGELFQYSIGDPVTLPHDQSAMLPIVDQPIQGDRVSIYNEAVLDRHPLAGVRLRNTTGLHLMGGPIALFEGGTYAGEAEMEDLAPGGERLLSYAVDLDTEVSVRSESHAESITRMRVSRGTLIIVRTQRRERDFTAVNRGDRARTLLVEYPVSSDWRLIAPAHPAEQTRDLYRFAIDLPGRGAAGGGAGSEPEGAAGAPTAPAATVRTLRVAEEREVSETAVIATLDGEAIASYAKQRALPPAVHEALSRVSRLRGELSEIQRERQGVEAKIAAIRTDQERIRGNLGELDHGTPLYNRYLAALNSQEDLLAGLVERLDALQIGERQKQKEIDDFVGSLDLS